MPLISKCPKCREPVTVPDGLDPRTEVRCPLCEAIYLLGQALPPALIPVDPSAVQPDRVHSATGEVHSATGEPDIRELDDDEVELAEEEAGRPPPVDTGVPPIDADALAALRLETSEHPDATGADDRAVRRRRRPQRSPLRAVIEVILGGVLAVPIAYYAICWIKPNHGLPKLPLPLLPHTMHWFAGEEEPVPGPLPTEEPPPPETE